MAAGSPTEFRIHYGNPAPPAPSFSPADVWDSGFMMVQHLNEVAGPVRDSTANGNDGAVSGATPTAWGLTDGAFAFDGIDDKITIPNHPTLQLNSTDFTIEAWFARKGVTADYLFEVTVRNDGPDPAEGVVVSDPLSPNFSLVNALATQGVYANPPGLWMVGDLPAGGTASLRIAANAVGCGALTNVAEVTVSGTLDPDSTPGNGAVGEDDLAQVVVAGPTVPASGVRLTQRALPAADGAILTIQPGDPVTYTYELRNTGATYLANLVVTDDKLGAIGMIPGPLAPNAAATLTAVVASVTADVTNVATVVGQPVDAHGAALPCAAAPVTDTDDAIVEVAVSPAPMPAIRVIKTAEGAADGTILTVGAGSAVTYVYTVSNVGNVAVSNVAAIDDRLGPIGAVPTLNAGESVTWTATAASVAENVTNVVTVTAAYGAQSLTAADDATVHVAAAAPAIEIVKIAVGAADGAVLLIEAGDNVLYTYTVRNAGNVPLTDVQVEDDKLGAVGSVASLPVGGTAVLTKTAANVTADVINVATATGRHGAVTVTDTDDAEVRVRPSAGADLSLPKELVAELTPPVKWTIPISKGEQFVDGDYWLRLEYNEPSFDVWGPGNLKSGVQIDRGWHHVAGRLTRGPAAWGPHRMDILVDGVVVASKTAAGTIDHSTAPLMLGAYLGNSYWYAGRMDEVRLSKRARSTEWLLTAWRQMAKPTEFVTAGAAEPGTLPGYLYRLPLTIQGAQVAGALADFPVLVQITNAALAQAAQADGSDLVFTTPAGTLLAFEMKAFDRSAGRLTAWVKVPSLAAGVNQGLWLHYGNAGAASLADPAGVWDADFVMVQHLEEAAGPVKDSTSFGNHGTAYGAGLTENGLAGPAYRFNGTSDKIVIPDSASLHLDGADFTVEGWFNREAVAADCTFKVTVANAGPAAAPMVAVLDVLPAALQFAGSTATMGSYDPASGLWVVGSLAAGQTATLYIAANLLAIGPVTNVAEVVSAGAPDPDSTPNNGAEGEDDQAAAVAPAPAVAPPSGGYVEPPDFKTTGIAFAPDPVTRGATFTARVTVENAGGGGGRGTPGGVGEQAVDGAAGGSVGRLGRGARVGQGRVAACDRQRVGGANEQRDLHVPGRHRRG